MPYDPALAQRVRDRLLDAAGVSEKKMFGGLAFLTSGNMTVGMHGDDLIVRIPVPSNAPESASTPVRSDQCSFCGSRPSLPGRRA